jgi:uncharacterized MAPEG superfamily protein
MARAAVEDCRAVPSRSISIYGLILLTAIFAAALRSASNSPEAVTATLERLSTRAESARQIAPETRSVFVGLLAAPSSDCRRLNCTVRLQQRNLFARAKLAAVIRQAAN